MNILDIFTHTGPHLHILINHVPSMGAVFALGLLIVSMWLKSEQLLRASLVVFALMALAAVPTYIAGAGARWAIQNDSDVARAVIAVHMDSATPTFLFLGATGVIAWLGLWQAQRYSHVPRWNAITVLVLGLITLGFLIRTGAIGGHINHLELGPVAGEVPGQAPHIETLMSNLKWAWPAGETVHFIGMSLIFGTTLLISARLLGLAKNVPFSALHRLLPIGVFGVLLNVLSGMYFFISDSSRYTNMQAFPLKIACLVLGGLTLLYFTIFPGAWSVKAGDDAPITAKAVALLAIASWAGVIVWGRLLPYYGSAGL